jgi:hypothetical protein
MQFLGFLKSSNPRLYKVLHLARQRYTFGIRNYKLKQFRPLDNLPNQKIAQPGSAWN